MTLRQLEVFLANDTGRLRAARSHRPVPPSVPRDRAAAPDRQLPRDGGGDPRARAGPRGRGHGLAPGEECLAAGLLDELVLVVGRRHPWARSREVAPACLAEEPLLVREEGSATRQVTERTLERAGVRWRVGMELNHTEAIKR